MRIKKIHLTEFLPVLVIILAGIFVRVWWINNVPTQQKYDFETYYNVAVNIYGGLGHTLDNEPVAWQGCGYPYALALYYKLTGNPSEINGKIFNIMLSALTLVCLYFSFLKIFSSRLYAYTALSIAALYPNLVAYVNVLGTETAIVFIMALILFIYLYIRKKYFLYPALGIACAAGALTKPYFLVYPVILSVIEWVDSKDIKQSALMLVFVSAFAILCVSPWAYRNYRLFHRLIPVSYNGGYVLYVNNNSSNITGNWMDLANVDDTPEIKAEINRILEYGGRSVKEAHELEPVLNKQAKSWIKSNISKYLKLGILRVTSVFFRGADDVEMWAMNGYTLEFSGLEEMDYNRNMAVIRSVFNMCLYIISASGFIFLLAYFKDYFLSCFTRQKKIGLAANFIFLNIAFFIVVFFVFEGHERYNMPVIPFLIMAFCMLLENISSNKKITSEKASYDQ